MASVSTKLDATKLANATNQAVAMLDPSLRPWKDYCITYPKLFDALKKGLMRNTPERELWAKDNQKLDKFVFAQHRASGPWDREYTKVVYQLVIWIFHFLKRYPDATNLTEKHFLAFMTGHPVVVEGKADHDVVKANYNEKGVNFTDGIRKWYVLWQSANGVCTEEKNTNIVISKDKSVCYT